MITHDDIVYFKNAGRMKENLVHVETNPLLIPERIREIDSGYFVMFNPDTQKYEIHHKDQYFTLALNLPYRELDTRAVIVILNTRIERIKEIQKEIEEHNAKIERDNERRIKDKVEWMANDIHKYAMMHDDDEQRRAFKEAYKTRMV